MEANMTQNNPVPSVCEEHTGKWPSQAVSFAGDAPEAAATSLTFPCLLDQLLLSGTSS